MGKYANHMTFSFIYWVVNEKTNNFAGISNCYEKRCYTIAFVHVL